MSRYVDCGYEALEDWCFEDTEMDKTYYLDYNDEILDLLNEQDERINELENTIIDEYKKARKQHEHYLKYSQSPTQIIYCEIAMKILDKIIKKLEL